MFDVCDILNKAQDDRPNARQSRRVALKTRGSLVVTPDYENLRRLPCVIIDASQGGYRLRANARLRRGQVVEVVSDDDPLTSVVCKVIWAGKTGSREQGEAGLQII
jgi:hypothetical protein